MNYIFEYRPMNMIENTSSSGNVAIETSGYLVLKLNGVAEKQWPARSGGWGKGTIPHGIWNITGCQMLDPNGAIADLTPYKREGAAWAAFLSLPMYVRSIHRDGFWVHPDGNVQGSLGCLVIERDDIDCYGTIKSVLAKQPNLQLLTF